MRPSTLIGFAAGPVATAALGLATVPLLTWTFDPADVGRYNTYQTIASFLILFTTLGLDQAFVREFHESDDRPSLLRASVIPGLIVVLLISVFGLVAGAPLAHYLYESRDSRLLPLTVLSAALAFFGRYCGLLLRMEERAVAYSILESLPKVGLIIVLTPVALSGSRPQFAHLLLMICGGLTLAVVMAGLLTRTTWLPAIRASHPGPSVAALLRFGLPLFMSSLIYWALAATGLVALRMWASLEELASYSVAMSFGNVAAVVQAMFTVVWAPVVYRWISEGSDLSRVGDIVDSVAAVACAVVVCIALVAPLSAFLLPVQYAIVPSLLSCTVLPPLLYTVGEASGIGIVVARKTHWAVVATCGALAFNLLGVALLVPRFGAAGAVVAGAIAFMVHFVVRTEVATRLWRPVNRVRNYMALGIVLALAITTTLSGAVFGRLNAVLWGGASLFVAANYRDTWSRLWTKLQGLRSTSPRAPT